MARTSKPKRRTRRAPQPGPQAPPEVWTPAELLAAVRRGTIEENIELLYQIGILDKNGELARKYRSWGNKVTRAPEG